MRRYDLDWLRNLAILLLFPFHTARVFDFYEANYVENSIKSAGLTHFIWFTSPWFMPLLFMIAGMAAFYALKKRTAKEFALERLQRLLIPFILGLVLIVPPQGYFAHLQQGTFSGNYFEYLIRFFTDFSDLSGYRGTFTPAHLWFILFLFVISMALLPFLAKLKKPTAQNFMKRIGSLLIKPINLILLFVPLTLLEAVPDIGGKNIVYYAGFFLAGYFIASNEPIFSMLNKIKYWLLAGAGIMAVPFFTYFLAVDALADFSAAAIAFAFLKNLWIWLILLAFLGLSAGHLNKSSSLLTYFNRAAFPVYILHQTVLIGTAYFIVQMDTLIAVKFCLITLISLALSFLFYEIFKRIPALRVVLGIKK